MKKMIGTIRNNLLWEVILGKLQDFDLKLQMIVGIGVILTYIVLPEVVWRCIVENGMVVITTSITALYISKKLFYGKSAFLYALTSILTIALAWLIWIPYSYHCYCPIISIIPCDICAAGFPYWFYDVWCLFGAGTVVLMGIAIDD